MVGFLKALLPPLLLATFAAAQITNPSSTNWWVAKSSNVLTWVCSNQPFTNFTVLISNSDQNVFPGILAIIAIQQNDACSISVSQDVVNQKPGTGYILSFANTINSSIVYVVSDPFEIKPLGSLYPSQVSSSASAASGTAAASSSPSASSSKGAPLSSYSPNFLGLTGIMGLLIVGLLSAWL